MTPWSGECTHEECTEIRYKIDGLGRKLYQAQCLTCGKPVGPFIPHSKINFDTNPFDTDLLLRTEKQEEEYYRSTFESRRQLYSFKHSEYLKTEKWKELRRKVLLRADGLCEGCRENPATQVHHLNYARWGREMLFDLVAVCTECHEEIHSGGDNEK